MPKRMKFLLLSMLFCMSMQAAQAQTVLKATDEHRNIMVELVLHDDGTFEAKEWFYDGSSLRDLGTWQRNGNEMILHSKGKALRQHPYMRYKKQVKFKGDRIQLIDGQVRFTPHRNRAATNYYANFKWVLLPTQHTPTQ